MVSTSFVGGHHRQRQHAQSQDAVAGGLRFKRFGRCVPPLFCPVWGAMGKDRERLKFLSSDRRQLDIQADEAPE